ncbi:hypothetical protein SAMN02744124_01820 [Paenibacillus barengoltzii J12]|uniref:Uncharacterized protein n=1 Tax=Paenibacillus barengoltzii J12 TaxID=935846 RepID=A0ABY1LWK4_9BACL|nr:hypothetical protein SAMN02744124_01820 [Paenibacillus barengoltzii J12]
MNRLRFLYGFTIYIAITGIVLLLKIPMGHSWLDQWIFNKFYVFQLMSVVTVGLAMESSRYQHTTCVRMGNRRKILRNELTGYYIQGLICVSILFFFIWLGAVLLNENRHLFFLFEWYIRYLLGTIVFINIMSCLKWSNHLLLSKYCQIIVFAWLVLESIVFIPYLKRFSSYKVNLIFSWIFHPGAASFLVLVGFILITLFLNIKLSDKRDFI